MAEKDNKEKLLPLTPEDEIKQIKADIKNLLEGKGKDGKVLAIIVSIALKPFKKALQAAFNALLFQEEFEKLLSYYKMLQGPESSKKKEEAQVVGADYVATKRSGVRWTPAEDTELTGGWNAGKSIQMLASVHGRSSVAILSRLANKHHGLIPSEVIEDVYAELQGDNRPINKESFKDWEISQR